jgi:hypothetical protein
MSDIDELWQSCGDHPQAMTHWARSLHMDHHRTDEAVVIWKRASRMFQYGHAEMYLAKLYCGDTRLTPPATRTTLGVATTTTTSASDIKRSNDDRTSVVKDPLANIYRAIYYYRLALTRSYESKRETAQLRGVAAYDIATIFGAIGGSIPHAHQFTHYMNIGTSLGDTQAVSVSCTQCFTTQGATECNTPVYNWPIIRTCVPSSSSPSSLSVPSVAPPLPRKSAIGTRDTNRMTMIRARINWSNVMQQSPSPSPSPSPSSALHRDDTLVRLQRDLIDASLTTLPDTERQQQQQPMCISLDEYLRYRRAMARHDARSMALMAQEVVYVGEVITSVLQYCNESLHIVHRSNSCTAACGMCVYYDDGVLHI